VSVRILTGDVCAILKTLPDESVHCVVTSPPYWGLRDYGLPPIVWGGDPVCEHEWGADIFVKAGGGQPGSKNRWQHEGGGPSGHPAANAGAYCGVCGAWRGALGLEPTLAMHIENLAAVFREVRRVLRKDGTVWLNYGDAYACAPNGRSAAATKAAGNDDRTFRDKPISTVGPILQSRPGDAHHHGKSGNKGASTGIPGMRAAAGGVLKPKDRMLLPARVAIALQDDGWWVRDEIIWHKPNPMPSSVKDRTTPAHEMIYMLSKSARYYYDSAAIREPAAVKGWNDGTRVYGGVNKAGANAKHGWRTTGRRTGKIKVPGGWDKGEGAHGTVHRGGRTEAEYVESETDGKRQKRSVWTVPPKGFKGAHFATFPPALIEPCILAGCPAGGTVLDPFFGAGTTGLVCEQLGRNCIGIELNPDYAALAERRIAAAQPELVDLLA